MPPGAAPGRAISVTAKASDRNRALDRPCNARRTPQSGFGTSSGNVVGQEAVVAEKAFTRLGPLQQQWIAVPTALSRREARRVVF